MVTCGTGLCPGTSIHVCVRTGSLGSQFNLLRTVIISRYHWIVTLFSERLLSNIGDHTPKKQNFIPIDRSNGTHTGPT